MALDNTVLEVDVDKTIKNGKKIYEQYQPLVEKRIKQLKKSQINSASFIVFSGDKNSRNSNEKKLIDELAWNDDQIGNFIKFILKLQKKEKVIGGILKWKCFYGMTDKEISAKMNIPERTIRYNKSKAFYQLAVYSNQVEFIYEKTYYFCLD